ncbi:MAG: UvrD-helicase domain-containing protein, partial [Planctomycetota bacterium]|nr:UvrD-helicase domain-containing protein [Planctomycetota bacterium]
ALLTSGRAAMDGIAAITFTEAAASELREKVRWALETQAQNPAHGEAERSRCLTALRGMERGSIQTLHSFAGALLRERPLEAGLPPSFDTIEEIEAGLDLETRWQEWLDQALESPEIGPLVLEALTLGLRLGDLRRIAESFHDSYDLLTQPFPEAEQPARRTARALIESVEEIQRLLPLARNGMDDPLASHAGQVAALGGRLAASGAPSDAALALLSRWGRLWTNRGKQSDWDPDPTTGKNGCTALKDLLKGLEDLRVQEVEEARRAAFLPLLECLRSFVLEYAEERRRSGRAEFHDLLVWARDLLRDDPQARNHFQQRFSHVLIDEFQDTDPIQAEIAFFLAGREGVDGLRNGTPPDWTRMKIVPGKLFMV